MTAPVLVGKDLAETPSRHGPRPQRLFGTGRGTRWPSRLVLAAALAAAGGAVADPGAGGSAEFAAIGIAAGDLLPAGRVGDWASRPAQDAVPETPLALSLSSSRAEPAYRFRGADSTELQSLAYRWWLGSGRAAVGFGLGSVGYVVPVPAEGARAATAVVGVVPTASIGLRYALSPSFQAYADGSRTRGLAGQDEVFYNAKAGIEWKPVKSRFGFEGGRLGVQLDSGYRMSFKTRKGGLTIYLRRTF